MKLIPLTQGRFARVDTEDYQWLARWKWSYGGHYAQRMNGTAKIYMHRLIMGEPKSQVDHKDNDKLNCQRYNLRTATNSQNSANKPLQSNNTSGYKGVSWYKAYDKWEAKIKHQGRSIKLGYFSDKLMAARAYDKAAIEYHGEFARLNNA